MTTDDERNTAVLTAAANYGSGHASLEDALDYCWRMGRISGLQSGIESIEAIFPPTPIEPQSLRVKL